MATYSRDSSDVVLLGEAAESSPLFLQQSDRITFVESNRANRGSSLSRDFLDLQEVHQKAITALRGTIDGLVLSEVNLKGVKVRSTYDWIIFVEPNTHVLGYRRSSDVLTFTESDTTQQCKPSTDNLVLVEDNEFKIYRVWGTADNLVLSEANGQYKPNAWQPSYTVPNTTTTDPIIFKYGATELSYRHYEFGNSETDEFTRVNRFTRGGFLIVGPITAHIETLDISFSLCGQAQCDTLLRFFRETLGKQIEFRDHESVWWNGIVLTPEAPRTQIGRNTFTMTVKFEGVRQ